MDKDVPAVESGEKVDSILDGRLRIIQKKTGYRFSLDALLLAYFAGLNEGEDLIDLGTGSGIIALILAARYPRVRVLGIEIQEQLATMASRSAALNGLDQRVEVRQGDIRRPETLCAPLSFDVAVFNPPYRRLRSGRMNPNQEKAAARHEVLSTAADFLVAAGYALREGGRVYTIYPATRMVEILLRMRGYRIEPKRLRMVHSRPDEAGKFSLVEGVKGGREELVVLPPLYIYEGMKGYSKEMATIFRELSASPAGGGD